MAHRWSGKRSQLIGHGIPGVAVVLHEPWLNGCMAPQINQASKCTFHRQATVRRKKTADSRGCAGHSAGGQVSCGGHQEAAGEQGWPSDASARHSNTPNPCCSLRFCLQVLDNVMGNPHKIRLSTQHLVVMHASVEPTWLAVQSEK